mgnify:CR=1 FL=1|tara:strand:+ start:750 stop:1004 length:255 start_codon:yes stop_codon:yes gene_type:complete
MKKLLNLKNKKLTFVRVFIIALPSYLVAFFTQKILFVVPTIAMMMMIANSIETGNTSNRNRIEDDNLAEIDADSDGIGDSDGSI